MFLHCSHDAWGDACSELGDENWDSKKEVNYRPTSRQSAKMHECINSLFVHDVPPLWRCSADWRQDVHEVIFCNAWIDQSMKQTFSVFIFYQIEQDDQEMPNPPQVGIGNLFMLTLA